MRLSSKRLNIENDAGDLDTERADLRELIGRPTTTLDAVLTNVFAE